MQKKNMESSIGELIEGMLGGSVECLSRLITLVEQGESSEVSRIMKGITPHTGKALCVGITGAPGVGKSTLIGSLTGVIRGKGLSVGIIAVDPSSPYHGGAMLGDRIRMAQHVLDREVFIRSMATRGAYGGIPKCTGHVAKLFDAFGKDIVIVETVGVGQTEIGVSEVADVTILVLSPESGDTIQFMKAGVIEIADLIVVNKADQGNAERLVAELTSLSMLSPESSQRERRVLTTQALANVGIEELYQEIEGLGRIARGKKA